MASAYDPKGVATQLSMQGFIGVIWAGAALGIVFTAIRIAIRLKLAKRLMIDDYLVLLALAFFVINAILQTLQAPHLYYMILDVTGPDIVYHGEHYTYYEFAIIGAIIRAIEIVGKAYSDQAALAVWGIAESTISMVVGCLPPFKSLIVSKSNASQYAYGPSTFNSNSYATPSLPKRKSAIAAWHEDDVPLQDRRTYQNLDGDLYKQGVHISGSRDEGVFRSKGSRAVVSEDEFRGNIKMVKEFSVVSSK
ncbi:uncharacterized protein N7496_010249 [Penicillium cataractarum]|uniref:Uncharacterized protein n=1 Tax=Penicillium cataractarum TaxID=2100454 RepID=A0A9W9RQY3_9EURO|nr:uncharacterized protein N7496_010249 [Penicillium cataractarum]KAJ5364536.1 hypothetical protein N7496_010249 [Penicillium cataractarum]